MNRKLSDLASIAEIAASIAVVVTLLLVVASMRENTNALQANTYQELMRDLNDFRAAARDSGLSLSAEGFSEVLATGELEQRERLGYLMLEIWGVFEAAFFARERGVLGDNEWVRFDRMICFERSWADDYKYWDSAPFGAVLPLTDVLTPYFVNYVDNQCQRP